MAKYSVGDEFYVFPVGDPTNDRVHRVIRSVDLTSYGFEWSTGEVSIVYSEDSVDECLRKGHWRRKPNKQLTLKKFKELYYGD